MRQCEKTAITFFADSSWTEVHDWTQRYMQGKAFFHSDIFVTQSSFSGRQWGTAVGEGKEERRKSSYSVSG